jgi:hypothetical protein
MIQFNRLTFVLLLFIFMQSVAQKSESDWKTIFLNPSDQYRPVPFWHINGKLTTSEIEKQMEAAKTGSGYGGVTVLPVTAGKQHPTGKPTPGMEPAFLSDDYFARYLDILEAAKKRGMQVILYDDIDFPSGSAGNLMKKLYPNDMLKYLEKSDTLLAGPATGGHIFIERILNCPTVDYLAAGAGTKCYL